MPLWIVDSSDNRGGEQHVMAQAAQRHRDRDGTGVQLAERKGVIAAIPRIEKPRRTDQWPHRFHRPEESARLLAALPWEQEPTSALAIYTAMEVGMRSGEILALRWKDLRWTQGESGALWVGEHLDQDGAQEWTTKTRRGRTVPLTPGLREAMQRQWVRLGQPEDGWIFESDRNSGRPATSFKASLKKACARAGVPLLHPHALRHTWATRMAIGGIPKMVTMSLGGWRTPAVLEKIYQHSVSELEVEAMARMAVVPAREPGERGKILKMDHK